MDKTLFKPAERMKHVSYPIRDIIMEAKKLEASGTKMIYLNIGDPAVYGFEPPKKFTEGVKHALDGNYKGYAPSPGDPELREVAAKLEGCPPEDVFITEGLTEGIDFFFHAFLGPGEKLLLPNPTYPLYITKVATYGINAIMYDHDANGEIDIADLEKKIPGAKAMVIINPNNPMGSVCSEANLRRVVELCAAHNVPIFYDGSYDRILFGEYVDFRKIAKGKVPFIYGSSMSKNFLYPGARVGWVAFHGEEWNDVKEPFFRMCNQRLSTNWEFQKGAAAAVTDLSHVRKFNSDLLARRDAMLKGTASLPLTYPKPMGAFYAFIQVDSPKWKGKTDWDFARAALREGIVFVPGSGFGKQEQKVHFRTIFLPSPEIMELAFRKIEKIF
ncbi:MAG: aminotransferase class I/II-fold pyridoxal phosphate-dependent enzyme [Candidatus ainarchaeum sp.]|nr:aminotransferase class I/II-fold pyridoxal phosphate-dependent enzyme [Candidatus ainarchaeum sp.]